MSVGIGATVFFAALALPALAAGIFPLEGAFGNAAGCRLYATGIQSPGYMLLTGDTFSSPAVGCDFESLVSSDKAVFIARATCSPGGGQTVQVIDHGTDGYGLIVGGGPEVGPLAACAPVNLTGIAL